MVLKLDSSNTEAMLRKAMLEQTIGSYRSAIRDYKIILTRYKYFIPAYIGIAEAEEALGNQKIGYQYRQMAGNIEKNKDYINRKNKQILQATNKLAARILMTRKPNRNMPMQRGVLCRINTPMW
jgi:lipopolysaccharide biosynthesis regulator YciM